MSTSIYIQGGPGFKQMLSHGPLSDSAEKLQFTVTEQASTRSACLGQQKDGDRQWFVYGEVINVGKFRQRDPRVPDEQVIIIETSDEYDHTYFILARYNTVSRRGVGELFTKEEFFAENPVAKFLRWDNDLVAKPHPAGWLGIFREPKGTPAG